MLLDEAIDMIRTKALCHTVVSERGNLWDTIRAQIAARDSFDGEHADTLLRLISEFLAGLDDETVIALWGQTETGMADDPDELVADFVRFELSEELLGEVTRAAWDEAT